ncbi:MAG: cob(I)yrinic acid a,c-diamide adenosyltransferase [Bacteroidales bacterium]
MTRKSNIYTKGGDRGETSLVGGKRVPKHHLRIESYGTVDELMSHTALLRDLLSDEGLKEDLLKILGLQMASASVLATDDHKLELNLPKVREEDIRFLEHRIDEMDATLEPLTSFLLPGGHPAVSQAHVARTVCRRAERTILRLNREEEVSDEILRFYNRLSDYFFVLSRIIARSQGVQQPPWKGVLEK